MQHFLLSAASRSLSLKKVYKMGEAAAYNTFRKIRWAETDGEAVCPQCGCTETYDITTRRKFKCKGCHHQFSVQRYLAKLRLMGATLAATCAQTTARKTV